MHDGEPCASHNAICAVLTAIREGVREMREEVKDVHSNSESVTRTLERHIERQDALEAALAESLKDLRQGFSEYREEHDAIVTELERHADVLEQVNINAKAVTNGGLTRALESALPAVLQAVGVREQARMSMWQNLGVALIGAIGGGILAWVSKQ